MAAVIERVKTRVYSISTDSPESDGTFEWDKTTAIVVQLDSQDKTGLGLTYGHSSIAALIEEVLGPLLMQEDPRDIPRLWHAMVGQVRNIGRPGLASAAISAVDIALWDLKAKLLGLPLCKLWGMARSSVPVYGSGGFTSYTSEQLRRQFEDWITQGIKMFKMKIGRDPESDLERVGQAKSVIGAERDLFVDANGAYDRKQALSLAADFAEHGVSWFEEPVSSDDLEGLHLLCNRAPAGMDITAGEYGYEAGYFRRMLQAGAVDVLQADATRCGGFTGFFQVAAVAAAFHIPLSSHTAPAVHLHACLSLPEVRHMEYFHDHVRIDEQLFEGRPSLHSGCLMPNLDLPGLGLRLKEEGHG